MHNCVEGKRSWKKWWTWIALGSVAALAGFVAFSIFRVPAATILIAGVLLLCPLLHLVGGHSHGPTDPSTGGQDGNRHH